MKALLIPVKDLRNAKQRLAPWLTQCDRTELASAMLDDFCVAAIRARGMDRIFLVSNYEPAIERALQYGWEVIRETEQRGESASVDAASRICADKGVTSLARVPIDLPLVTPEDITSIFAVIQRSPSAVIVPSRCETGTNALLRTPPTLFPSHFGPNSFPKHLAEAKKCGAECVVLRNERLELDMDDWDDLRTLARRMDVAPATRRWLDQAGFSKGARTAGASQLFTTAIATGDGCEK
jgi:2-phospho-L-lactate guanylyltransferase